MEKIVCFDRKDRHESVQRWAQIDRIGIYFTLFGRFFSKRALAKMCESRQNVSKRLKFQTRKLFRILSGEK